MKKYVISIILILVSCTALCSGLRAPSVFITSAAVFDRVCSYKTHYAIANKWRTELNHELPLIKNAWDRQGLDLLLTTETITGMPFRQPSYRVVLSLCNFPSMSDPLIVNMRYSLKSFTSKPLLRPVTISIIYHEILHVYLKGRTPAYTGPLAMFNKENDVVKNHLFLFAIQQAVYTKLDEINTLKAVIAKDKSLPDKYYTRAWDLVQKHGAQFFIKYLKKSERSNPS